jgi:hypothetical protein
MRTVGSISRRYVWLTFFRTVRRGTETLETTLIVRSNLERDYKPRLTGPSHRGS